MGDHEGLAEAARHEKVAHVLDEPSRPNTGERDTHEVQNDDDDIEGVQAGHAFPFNRALLRRTVSLLKREPPWTPTAKDAKSAKYQ
jgi:hypothetical protein